MKIAILTHNPHSYSHRRLAEAGQKEGHEVFFIHMSHCYMSLSSTAPAVYYRNNEMFEDLTAIIPRIHPIHIPYGTAVLRQFEMLGVFALNSSLALTWAKDKLRTLQILARKKLPLPITGSADSPQEIEKLVSVVGGAPLIIRLLEGPEGKETVFAETHQAAVSVINAFKQLKANIVVQEYIQEAEGKDIRCVVVGNQVITAVERFPNSNTNNTRHHSGRALQAAPVDITPQERKMAIKAAKSMKLNLASVDLIRSNRGPLILDIEPSPNIELLEKTTHTDIATPILQFIAENAKKPC